MVVKKDGEKEKKTVQIKATTGAWWKSTTTNDVVADTSKAAESKKEVEAATKPKAAPKKRVRKKPVAKVSAKEEDVVAGEESRQATKKTPPARKPAGRRPARKTKETTEKKTPTETAPIEQPEVIPEVVPEVVEAVVQVEQLPVEEKVAPKRPRGRRGRGAGKKPVVVEETSVTAETSEKDAVPAEGAVGTAEAGPEKVAASSSPADSDEQAVVAEPQPVKEKPARVATARKEEVRKISKLLINAEEPEECRLALLEDGRLESIHVSTISRTQTKSNIYKARIVAIEPSLQAAFVDYGTEKNGFLPFSEIHPEYYKQELSAEIRQQVENNQWKKINITDVVERGQEILAQVVKEEVGKKGANMTTFLSIPGRCVVLMPGSDSAGISRKISGEQRRSQLRDTMTSMDLPEGIGWIVRTASVDITQEALSRDVEYLLELWSEIKNRGQDMDGVGLVYEDHRSVLRFLREHFDPSIQEILVDDKTALEQVKEFVEMLPAKQRTVNVRFHQGARPIFNQYSVEDQIESIYQPQVSLPSGGSIVIDPTEALVAIDVNSGSTSRGKNFEASIFQANMEAAAELARQLRLRDLGGLVVVDFIDMRNKKHILAVEREVKVAMKKDKAKVDFSRISKFGLMQISRQKLGAPIEAGNYRRCEHCKGRGTVRSVETLSLYYLRRIQTGASRKAVERIECHFPLDVASYLLNNKRSELSDLEQRYQVEISILAEVDMKPADHELIFHKAEKDTNTQKQA
ncbi:MAG: Rne/Rng family ribonuclease [Desulfobulbaceae bacterium]|nr:Rne/Rng family ribonuclease [Desulfobulbaceae bacterium]